ncbi:unnamed protein product, partial [Mesorhabditis belari]|uniref:RNase H type-1 domain-containing protein n=1 Tax=Mesorhabditis belari TaxID=2138241 RepID=A0AAF3JAA3_9BILA
MFFGNGHPLELGLHMGNGLKSSFLVELFAIIVALCRLYCWAGYQDQPIILRTDCKSCVTAIAKGTIRNNLKFVRHILDKFPAKVVLQWVEAHSTSNKHPGNQKADELAVKARRRGHQSQSPKRSLNLELKRSLRKMNINSPRKNKSKCLQSPVLGKLCSRTLLMNLGAHESSTR